MALLILIRGASAVGKTTITKKILKRLKVDYKKACAYICEDDFRKQMQFKYKAKDLEAHMKSVELIKIVIKKLLEMDDYDYIFVEGQFRYPDVITAYEEFIKKNRFNSVRFQLELNINEMKRRDQEYRNVKSKDIEEVKQDIDLNQMPDTIKINTNKPIDESCKEIIGKILL